MFSLFYNTEKRSKAFLVPDFLPWVLPKSIIAETSIDDNTTKQKGRNIWSSFFFFFSFITHNLYSAMSKLCLIEKHFVSSNDYFHSSSHKILKLMENQVWGLQFQVLKREILKWFILDFNPCPHDSLKPIKESMKYLSKILKQLNSLFSVCLLCDNTNP